jgi:hypothetical protein
MHASDEVETYADYTPVQVDLGRPHPDPVVETSTTGLVTSPGSGGFPPPPPPPGHLLGTSFHTIFMMEFCSHLPSSPLF